MFNYFKAILGFLTVLDGFLLCVLLFRVIRPLSEGDRTLVAFVLAFVWLIFAVTVSATLTEAKEK